MHQPMLCRDASQYQGGTALNKPPCSSIGTETTNQNAVLHGGLVELPPFIDWSAGGPHTRRCARACQPGSGPSAA